VPLREIRDHARVIGTKQVNKAIAKGQVDKVYLARDAEPHIVEPIHELCRQKNISVVMVDTMESLGKACGIEVGAAAVALVHSH
jgi:large subunit ribosomal protein L7A